MGCNANMKKTFLFTLSIVLIGLASFSLASHEIHEIYDSEYYSENTIKGLETVEDGFSFLVLGDWGRNGHFHQRTVAKWMDIAAAQADAEFVATTGDNFYSNGIASINDPYWRSSFEDVYTGPNLFIDWYATLGNHDYRGNWQAQIDYSDISRRWQMPAPYYAKTVDVSDNTSALLLFVDTSPLNPAYESEKKYAAAMAQDGDAQLAWIHKQLSESKAEWKIVIGHHPLYSSGKRYGKTSGIRNVIEPVLEQYGVQAYFAGHEHDLQHNRAANKQVEHFVSGAGSELRPVKQREFTLFAESQAGFAIVSMDSTQCLVQFVNNSGEVIYRYTISLSKDK